MAVTIWQNTDVKFCDVEVLASGAAVSVSVWKSGDAVSLRCKIANGNGSWPADDDAYKIADLTKSEPFFVRQLRDGKLLIGNGKDKFYRSDTGQPKQASDWKAVNVL